ncbi:hypothetical protein CRE_06022 [Caenorhabditis remanei]|uniref:DUF38 domain-containing protein n=1 Tax=Caenorhabditis remanei TaxID=31234 RepID=E3N6J7_CAERE|nr:hypothetical protein CRE_06022 [Caenorhabditis remanei]
MYGTKVDLRIVESIVHILNLVSLTIAVTRWKLHNEKNTCILLNCILHVFAGIVLKVFCICRAVHYNLGYTIMVYEKTVLFAYYSSGLWVVSVYICYCAPFQKWITRSTRPDGIEMSNLTYMKQVIQIVKLLDPNAFQNIEFCFNHGSSSQLIHIEHVLSLVKWNRGDRLKLVFNINREEFEVGEKSELDTKGSELEIYYTNCVKENLEEYFGIPCQSEPGKFIRFEITEELSDELLLAEAMEKLKLINLLSTQALETPVIMRHISQNLEFFDIQRLRKTTRGIRNCIDYIQPDLQISEYTIAFLLEKKPHTVVKTRKGYLKTTRYGRDVNFDIKNSECRKAVSRMLEDLETNLKQKGVLKELQIVFSYIDFIEYDPVVSFTKYFLDRFKTILTRSEKPLKIEKLVMKCVTQREVMQVLPFLDSSHLKTIELHDPDSEFQKNYRRYEYPEGLRKPFEVNELCELEQWKNAVGELIIDSGPINMVVRKMNICNFSKVNITVEKISTQDILYLKEVSFHKGSARLSELNFYHKSDHR